MLIQSDTPCELRTNLPVKHQGVRIDRKTTAIPMIIPKGASGKVIEQDAQEIYLELYWNPTRVPGQGYTAWLWIKREFFGVLVTYKR